MVPMNRKIFLFFALIVVLGGFTFCNRGPALPDISGVELEPVVIHRYEKALFTIPPDSLQQGLKAIAPNFPVFLEADLDDPQNVFQLYEFVTDPLNRQLYKEVMKQYPDLSALEVELTKALKYFRYYFPDKPLTSFFSYVSGLVFDHPVQVFNGNMIIALDMYLGSDIEAYRKMRMPLYQIERMNRENILKDAMMDFYYYHFLDKPANDFLSRMVNRGKQLYFLDLVLPETPDHIKIGYRREQLAWCNENESNLWGFMIQNDVLYKNETPLIRKFFTDGPFTKDFTGDSPARLGEWMGWMIVRSFMENNPGTTFDKLNDLDAQTILNQSGYKPRK
jgi:hypothetical protein